MLLLACTWLLGGCADDAGPAFPIALDGGGASSDSPVPIGMESPVALGPREGLELRWWVTDSPASVLGEAIAEFAAHPIPLEPSMRELWETSGLRLVAVPLDRLAELQSRLATVGAINQQWIGQSGAWIDAVVGRERPRATAVTMPDGALVLPPGQLRLLARCWVGPGSAASADNRSRSLPGVLWVELVPQHDEEHATSVQSEFSLRTSKLDPLEHGLVFSRLRAQFGFTSSSDAAEAAVPMAYLIIPQRPDQTWDSRAPDTDSAAPVLEELASSESPTDGSASFSSAPAPPIGRITRVDPAAPTEPSVPLSPSDAGQPPGPDSTELPGVPGPPAERTPSLGEAMLVSRSVVRGLEPGNQRRRTVRAIVILVPHTPRGFSLLGRSDPATPRQ